ncbi:MAG: hypothetical protein OEQ39_00215 [Gammaproteobacteria bacterium]|nr:hypothetical protein [Gammaproteobacteria bacterium]
MSNLTQKQRKQLIAMLNEKLAPTKHGRMSNEKLIEIATELANEEGKPSMGEILSKYRPGYAISVTPNGRKSRYNADDVAETLVGYEPSQIIGAGEKLLGFKKGELFEKYEGMNQGQQRMNIGNRLRAAVKRGDITVEEIAKALHK